MHPPAPFLVTDIVFSQEIPRPVCIQLASALCVQENRESVSVMFVLLKIHYVL